MAWRPSARGGAVVAEAERGQEPEMRSIGLPNISLSLPPSRERDRQGDLHRLSGVIRCVREINSTEENSRNCRRGEG